MIKIIHCFGIKYQLAFSLNVSCKLLYIHVLIENR